MLSDITSNISSGSISTGIEAEKSIKAVVLFIKTNFKLFAESNKNELGTLNEKGISQKLCIFLNKEAKNEPFFFQPEFIENIGNGNSPQVDIGTIASEGNITISDREYSEEDSFFSIEAKRLPTPGASREKEYVVGKTTECGGIERFKKGIHGSRLKYACIIGYVQAQDFDHWFLTINSWIKELAEDANEVIWSETDKISWQEKEDSTCVELFSTHNRQINGNLTDAIPLYHFWLNLRPN